MRNIAYLANQFPSPVEPYVTEEIEDLRRRHARIVACSVRAPSLGVEPESEVICLQPLRAVFALRAVWLLLSRWEKVSRFIIRALLQGNETLSRRVKALLHTWLGAYYALLLEKSNVKHIHVHHGYFGSWIGMVAASLLEIGFSMTLHGSDLLIHDAYLDTKLAESRFCFTISEYNRRHILTRFPAQNARTVMVSRLGVEVRPWRKSKSYFHHDRALPQIFSLLTVGRLHPVKNQAFLVRVCGKLRDAGVNFLCEIAGEGPERKSLEQLIAHSRLECHVKLLGHLSHDQLNVRYRETDLFVLTSVSEGIPLVLMEAMAAGTIVLAPAITGIPELVIPGVTGFLYEPGNMQDFRQRVIFLHALIQSKAHGQTARLSWIRHAGRVQVHRNFDRQQNLLRFGDLFLKAVSSDGSVVRENPLLQQI